MRNGKDAYGTPEKWDAFEISGRNGSIIIDVSDWEALRPFRVVAPSDSGKMFLPNEVTIKAAID